MENKKICIVEDNVPIRKLFTTILKKSGYEIADFGDGESAINWLKDNEPLILICDILLPDMNGTEIMKFAKGMPYGNKVPMVAATGFCQVADREKFLEDGFDAFISKPIDTSTFVQEIETFIKEKNDSLK